jgi:hypothetical protein
MKYMITGDLSQREVDNEIFVLNRGTGRIHSFSETGADMWRMMMKGTALEAIAEAITIDYEIDRATVEKDLDEFLTGLSAKGLVLLEQ